MEEKLLYIIKRYDNIGSTNDNFVNGVEELNDYSSQYLDRLLFNSIIKKLYFLFIHKDLVKAKQEAYLIGRCLEIDVCIFEEDGSLGLWARSSIFLLLSDNKELINRFAHIKTTDYKETLKYGSWVACIQASLRDDWEFLDKQIPINLKRDKTKSSLEDAKFFEGLRDGNIPKMEEAINQLGTKFHKRTNDESIMNELLSILALGYAKLAWIKGYEVNINNPLVPKELLPIKPNDEYWEYDFMKTKEFQCKK